MGILNFVRALLGYPTNRSTTAARVAEASKLMDLCDCTVEDITTAFLRENVNDLVDPQEGLAFAMALTTELYSLGQGSAARAKPGLDDFHLTTEAQLLEHLHARGCQNPNKESLDTCTTNFFALLQTRYPQYREAIRSQVVSPHPSWFALSQLVLQNVFGDRLPADRRQSLLVPFTAQLGLTILYGLTCVAPSLPSFSVPPMVPLRKRP